MTFIQYITLVLLSLQPSYSDNETWVERTGRMEIVAQAIDDASSKATCSDAYAVPECKKVWNGSKRDLGLLLVTKGFWESGFAKNVHEGKCMPKQCDSIIVRGNIVHLARSPWQIQRTGLVGADEYSKMKTASLESTTISANVAVRYLSMGMNRCSTIHGAMAIYGGANSCDWPGVAGRVAFYKSLLAKTEQRLVEDSTSQKKRLEERLSKRAGLVLVKDSPDGKFRAINDVKKIDVK